MRERAGRNNEPQKNAGNETESELLAFLKNSWDAVLIGDQNLQTLAINQVAETLTGWEESESAGKPLTELIHIVNEHTRKPVTLDLDRTLAEGIVFGSSEKLLLLARNGVNHPVSYLGIPVRNAQGTVTGIAVILHDQHASGTIRSASEIEKSLRRLAENVHDIIYRYDLLPKKRFTYVNPACEIITGYSPDEFYADPLLAKKIIHPQDLAQLGKLADISHLTRTEAVIRWIRKDGSTIWIEHHNVPVHDSNGTLIAIEGIARNVTQQKQAEEQLALQSAALNAAANAIVITGVDGIIQWVNAAFTDLTGYTSEEAIGQNPRILKSGLQDHGFYVNLWRSIAAGKVWQGEFVNRRKDGTLYTEEQTITPLRDQNGKITHFIGIKQDITKRKESESALAESELRYRQFFEQDLTADFVVSVDGDLQMVNPAFVKMFGFRSEEEALGTNTETLWPTPAHRARFLERLRGERMVSYESLELRKRDGSPLFVIANVVGEFDQSGDLATLRAYLFDETPRKLLEEQFRQAQKMESLGTLASGIAHDFNNVLSIILGHASLMELESANQERSRRSLTAIMTSVQRGADLVKQILTFARRTGVQLSPIHVNAAIKELADLLRNTFPKSMVIQLQLEKDIPVIVVDNSQFNQAMLNLCVNARDAIIYDPKRITGASGCITLSTRLVTKRALQERFTDLKSDRYVCVSVADNGMGISTENLEKIYEPFFTTKGDGKGTGLGLSVVYGVAKSHDAQIHLVSAVGKGSTFSINFPVTDVNVQGRDEGRYAVRSYTGSETILLVEDEPSVREALAEVLQREGYQVITARDGSEGRDLLLKHRPMVSVVVSDMGMPGMSGLELLKAIRLLRSRPRFVLVSGYVDPKVRIELDKNGCDLIIEKPYSMDSVLEGIRLVLETNRRR